VIIDWGWQMSHIQRLSKKFVFATIVLLIANLQVYANGLAMIPEKVTKVKSPDGAHEVFDVNKGFSADGEQNRELCIRTLGHKGTQRLLTYHRCVDVAWSPDSSAFIVNDNAGSNLVIPHLYKVNDLSHPVDLSSGLMSALRDKKDKFDIEQSDVFLLVYASRWINRNALELTVRGAGQRVGCFKIVYEWDLKNSFKKLKRVNDV
jgi:hypothetical protein